MPEKRAAKLNCRIPQKLKDDLDALYENYRVDTTAAVEDALSALIEYVAREGYYRRPMMMIAKEPLAYVAEEQASSTRSANAAEIQLVVVRALQAYFRPAEQSLAMSRTDAASPVLQARVGGKAPPATAPKPPPPEKGKDKN